MTKLDEYRRKRRFEHTPEPAGQAPTAGEQTFVVQKHAARRLHYDFRLAIDRVLKSWAVPKGPSLNPGEKRLAVETEDHPLEYADFEGTIPPGSYGAGTVMVWDRGTFTVEGDSDAARQLERGELKFHLEGEKLCGSFVLVRFKGGAKGNEWLLIKHRDAAADPSWSIDEHDGSVLTGRTMAEIAGEDPPRREPSPARPEELRGARRSAMPSRIAPMLAKLIEQPFSDPNWLFEIKWDGVRTLAWIADGRARLRSRAGNDITGQYPEMDGLPECLQARSAIVDGELVVLNERGHSDFARLQKRMHVRRPPDALLAQAPVSYYLFDLLYCDGYDLREAPLAERKQLLRRLLKSDPSVRYLDHVVEQGEKFFALARAEGLEGIIGKRADSRYTGERSGEWVKLKVVKSLDAVVGGWTEPRAGRSHFGSLLLGLYQDKALRFIGHVGSGFDEQARAAIAKELAELRSPKCPFDVTPKTNEKAHWTRPALVARVRFSGWTEEKRLRHPVFLALRRDAKPEDCRWETEVWETEVADSASLGRAKTAGSTLTGREEIEAELFRGRRENVTIEMEGRRLRLANLNKVYFPEPGYTKRDLLAYYYRMADIILPFLKDRPLVLRRYPDGITGQAFFQKDARQAVPDWLETVAIRSEEKGEEIHYALAQDRASLLYLTGLGCIDHNPWSSRRDDPEHPDYFFFDLDPAEGTEFSVVIQVAQGILRELDAAGLRVFLKTSGATGFHLYVPVERRYRYEQLRTLAEIVARLVTAQMPDRVTQQRAVAKRPKGRVLIDVQQNASGRPLAAPYSVRAFPGAPVSAPILREELRASLRPAQFDLGNIPARIKKKGEPWADFWKSRQTIEEAVERLAGRLQQAPRRATLRTSGRKAGGGS